MRPAEYSDETVIEAGCALQAEGRRVTGYALRQRIGGGAPDRLRLVWQDYLTAQTQTPAASPVETLPAEFADALDGMTTALLGDVRALALKLWQQAMDTAEKRTREAFHAAKEAQDQAEAELQDANAATVAQDARINELVVQLAAVKEEKEAARREVSVLQDRLRTAETAQGETRAEMQALRQEVRQAQAQTAEARSIAAMAERESQTAMATLTARETAYEEAKAARETLEREVIRLETEVKALHESRAQAEHHVDQLAMALANLRPGGTAAPAPSPRAGPSRRGKPPGDKG